MTTDLNTLLNKTLAGRIVKQMDQNDVTKNDNKIEAKSWNSIMDQIGRFDQKIDEGQTMSMLKAITLLTKMACADAAKAKKEGNANASANTVASDWAETMGLDIKSGKTTKSDAAKGANGANGTNGANGSNAAKGANGANGANNTKRTVPAKDPTPPAKDPNPPQKDIINKPADVVTPPIMPRITLPAQKKAPIAQKYLDMARESNGQPIKVPLFKIINIVPIPYTGELTYDGEDCFTLKDDNGRIIQKINGGKFEEYSYDENGNRTAIIYRDDYGNLKNTVHYFYDENNKNIGNYDDKNREYYIFDPNSEKLTTFIAYNENGSVKSMWQNKHDGEGNPVGPVEYYGNGQLPQKGAETLQLDNYAHYEKHADGSYARDIYYDKDGNVTQYTIFEYDNPDTHSKRTKEITYDKDGNVLYYYVYDDNYNSTKYKPDGTKFTE